MADGDSKSVYLNNTSTVSQQQWKKVGCGTRVVRRKAGPTVGQVGQEQRMLGVSDHSRYRAGNTIITVHPSTDMSNRVLHIEPHHRHHTHNDQPQNKHTRTIAITTELLVRKKNRIVGCVNGSSLPLRAWGHHLVSVVFKAGEDGVRVKRARVETEGRCGDQAVQTRGKMAPDAKA